jgi:hypothetical protein
MTQIKGYIYKNPARVYAFCFAFAAFITRMYPEIPIEALVVVLLAFLGVGDKVQKVEDQKTLKALYTDPPKDSGR